MHFLPENEIYKIENFFLVQNRAFRAIKQSKNAKTQIKYCRKAKDQSSLTAIISLAYGSVIIQSQSVCHSASL
jgi:hypothetical protein